MRRGLVEWVLVAWIVAATRTAAVQGDSHESFETPNKTWQLGRRDCDVRIVLHERRFTQAHSGHGCEYLELWTGLGTQVQLVHPVTSARIIPELLPSLWIKADRPGLQLQARIVFPRSFDKDGNPLTSLVFGDSYVEAGNWRQLRIEGLAQKLNREAVGLRSRGVTVDEREAYVDRLVLNAYSEPGFNRVWLDDLELQGFVAAREPNGDTGAPATAGAGGPELGPERGTAAPTRPPMSGLHGNVLLVDSRPVFVRAVEHRGETFAFLESLGFNAVALASPPTDAQLAEARRAEMWLLAPPPTTDSGITIHPAHRCVIAWLAGENLTSRDAERVNQLLSATRQAETQPQRPVLLHVASGLSHYHQDNGIPVFQRSLAGTSFELNDFSPWLIQASRQGRPQSAFWVAIPTEPLPELLDQIARLSQASPASIRVEPNLIRRVVFDAVAAGARGLWFRSSSRLDSRDEVTQVRAAALHMLNRELELIAPWIAAGTAEGERGTDNPQVRARSLRTESARLLVVTRVVSDQQFETPPSSGEPVTFDVHGIPASDSAYSVAPQGVTPLSVQRGGSVRVTLDTTQIVSLILLTQDPRAINYVHRVAADIRSVYATRQLELARLLLAETENVHGRLWSRRGPGSSQDPSLTRAGADLRHAAQLLDNGNAAQAIVFAGRCLDECRRMRRRNWETAALSFPSPISSPLCTSYSTLPLHYATAERLARSPWSVNVLAAGDMEQMDHLLQSGWRMQRADQDNNVDVRLMLDAPRSGRSALQVRVWQAESGQGRLTDDWPVSITSAPISVREGQLLRIHGWAKVPQRFSDSWDGLMIFDSQTGPGLAERIIETQGWQEFLLYRVAKQTGDLHVLFAHTGLGESWLDEISVTLQEPLPREHSPQP